MIIWFTLFSILVSADGHTHGNGGDVIKCLDGKTYAWDYMLTESRALAVDPFLLDQSSAETVLKEVTRRIYNVFPIWGDDFSRFIKRMAPNNFSIRGYSWSPGIHSLPQVYDESMHRLPESCTGNSSVTETRKMIRQAVIRKVLNRSMVKFEFDELIFQELENNHPVQLSFLLIHEWLRNYFMDSSKIAEINRILHSEPFALLDEHGFYSLLKRRYGYLLPAIKPVPTFKKYKLFADVDLSTQFGSFETVEVSKFTHNLSAEIQFYEIPANHPDDPNLSESTRNYVDRRLPRLGFKMPASKIVKKYEGGYEIHLKMPEIDRELGFSSPLLWWEKTGLLEGSLISAFCLSEGPTCKDLHFEIDLFKDGVRIDSFEGRLDNITFGQRIEGYLEVDLIKTPVFGGYMIFDMPSAHLDEIPGCSSAFGSDISCESIEFALVADLFVF